MPYPVLNMTVHALSPRWEWDEEFEALVYLDADMVVLRQIDHLLDDFALRPHARLPPAATAPCARRRLSAADSPSATNPPAAAELQAATEPSAAAQLPPSRAYWIGAVQACVYE